MSTVLLTLTEDQLHIVLAGAERVPHTWRRRFFDNCSDLLINQLVVNTEITDADVQTAVNATLLRIGGPALVESAA